MIEQSRLIVVQGVIRAIDRIELASCGACLDGLTGITADLLVGMVENATSSPTPLYLQQRCVGTYAKRII